MTEHARFFQQLQVFSERFFKAVGIEEMTSPWHAGAFRDGKPRGAIIHYTEDSKISGSVAWFMRQKYGAKASAHVVVADRRMSEYDPLLKDLDLVAALPVTVIQCVPPDRVAWHATWTNDYCYGIENANAGDLEQLADGSFVNPSEVLEAYTDNDRVVGKPWKYADKKPVQLYGRFWEPFTPAQVETNVLVLRHLQGLFGSLKPEWVLSHECVQKNKFDTGPAFPLHGVRLSTFDTGPLAPVAWFQDFQLDPLNAQAWRDGVACEWAGKSNAAEAWDELCATLRNNADTLFDLDDKVALHLLGYATTIQGNALSHADETSLWIFRECMKIDHRSYHQAYRKALVERLTSRGFLTRPEK